MFVDPLLLPDRFRDIANDFVKTVYKVYDNGNKSDALQLFSHLDILRVTPKGQVFQ